jgi:hypothetical protein
MSYKRRSVKRRSIKRKSNARKSSVKRGGCNSGGKKLKLLSIKKSPKKEKKLVATFCKNNRIKQTHFGDSNAKNYCGPSGKGKFCHNDAKRRSRYLARHKKHENWNDPTSAGALSALILWGKGTVRENIGSFKRKFKL